MKTTNSTVLITGGGAGIGFSIAEKFSKLGNTVIIAARNEERLMKASAQLKNTTAIVADVTNEGDLDNLVARVKKDFGGIDILINNAGVLNPVRPGESNYDNGKLEFEVNFFSVIRLIDKMIPLLNEKKESAIVNVSSGTAYITLIGAATYCASKAALHSYTQNLRLSLERTGSTIKVFEVMPAYVETDMVAGLNVPKISASEVADDLLHAMSVDQFEIHNGETKEYYGLYLSSPDNAIRQFNSRG